MEEFYIRLKKAMDLRKITQKELCEKTGIPKSAMSQYISGSFKPKQERTYLIAKALDVSIPWLLGHDVPIDFNGLFFGIESTDEEDISDFVWRHFPQRDRELAKSIIFELDKINHVALLEISKRINEMKRLEEYMNEEILYALECEKEEMEALYSNDTDNPENK